MKKSKKNNYKSITVKEPTRKEILDQFSYYFDHGWSKPLWYLKIKWFFKGLYNRYPLCCIMSFCNLRSFENMLKYEIKNEKEFKKFKKAKLNYVPCKKCLIKILK